MYIYTGLGFVRQRFSKINRYEQQDLRSEVDMKSRNIWKELN